MSVTYVHYVRRSDGEFDYIARPTAAGLDLLFGSVAADVLVFGDDHRPLALCFKRRLFLNPGSLGCYDRAEARALILTKSRNAGIDVSRVTVPYDDSGLIADFERRTVPAREFIRRTLITRE
jgi:predicted phosphodiesterase